MSMGTKIALTLMLIFDMYCLISVIMTPKTTKKEIDTEPIIVKKEVIKKELTEFEKIEKIKYDIRKMTDRDFEIFCTRLFRLSGYDDVTLTKATNDGGKDIILYKEDIVTYVECKHFSYEGKVSRPIAQKLYGAIVGDGADFGIIVTTGKITKECLEWCEKVGIKIIDMNGIIKLIKKIGLGRFYLKTNS